jgi:hypothetical protein
LRTENWRNLNTDPEVPDSIRGYKVFLEAVGVERYPLSLMRITEELFRRNNSSSGIDNID